MLQACVGVYGVAVSPVTGKGSGAGLRGGLSLILVLRRRLSAENAEVVIPVAVLILKLDCLELVPKTPRVSTYSSMK